mmetsp:Transcript_2003/g.8327  ORF Transcript_2003/g.8327 Transcript_2003/m.8327 type:complete len:259 (-) Transcript_2003:280-1056(-)
MGATESERRLRSTTCDARSFTSAALHCRRRTSRSRKSAASATRRASLDAVSSLRAFAFASARMAARAARREKKEALSATRLVMSSRLRDARRRRTSSSAARSEKDKRRSRAFDLTRAAASAARKATASRRRRRASEADSSLRSCFAATEARRACTRDSAAAARAEEAEAFSARSRRWRARSADADCDDSGGESRFVGKQGQSSDVRGTSGRKRNARLDRDFNARRLGKESQRRAEGKGTSGVGFSPRGVGRWRSACTA